MTALVSRGEGNARRLRRARILLLADENQVERAWKDADIANALGAHARTVERTREKCVEMGVEAALNHTRPWKTRAKVFDGAAEMEKVVAWERRRNAYGSTVNWRFTTDDARIKLHRLYPTIDVC